MMPDELNSARRATHAGRWLPHSIEMG
jgi:hypothetical protein